MGYLFDTHVIVWAAAEPDKLSPFAKGIIEDPDIDKFISPISVFEIGQKVHKQGWDHGGYVLDNLVEVFNHLRLIELPFITKHAEYAGMMNWEHSDPFDKMLVGQALSENLKLLTYDKILRALPINIAVWD